MFLQSQHRQVDGLAGQSPIDFLDASVLDVGVEHFEDVSIDETDIGDVDFERRRISTGQSIQNFEQPRI